MGAKDFDALSGVEHDPKALREAAERMHAPGSGSTSDTASETTEAWDTTADDVEHDETAAREAAARMHATGDRGA